MAKMTKCTKCGQPIIKWTIEGAKAVCLDGYGPDPELCYECNAVNSVVKRLNEGGDVNICDLKKLPKILRFNPRNNDENEELCGIKLQKIISVLEKTEQ